MTKSVDLLVHDAKEVFATVFEAIKDEIKAGREAPSIGIGIAAALHEIREHCTACQRMVDYAQVAYYEPPPEEHGKPPEATKAAYAAMYGEPRP